MAFSLTDMDNIRTITGYASRFYQTTNQAVEQAMAAISSSDAQAVTTIQGYITNFLAIESAMQTAATTYADAKRVGNIEPALLIGQAMRKQLLDLWAKRICDKLGIPRKTEPEFTGLNRAFGLSGGGGSMRRG
jgi:hypothetical protein